MIGRIWRTRGAAAAARAVLFGALLVVPAAQGVRAEPEPKEKAEKKVEPTEVEQRAIAALVPALTSGVIGCCKGLYDGCARYQNAQLALMAWCAKEYKPACEIVRSAQEYYVVCSLSNAMPRLGP